MVQIRDANLKRGYLSEILKRLGTTLEEFDKLGISINEIEQVGGELYGPISFRNMLTKIISSKYGSVKAYSKTPQFIKRRADKSRQACLERFGVDNPSKLESNRKKLRNNHGCFSGKKSSQTAQEKIKKSEYIKGKRVLPEDAAAFELYRNKVWELTKLNVEKVKWTGKCYYSDVTIFKSTKDNYNEPTTATIDHKYSVVRGFLDKTPPEYIARPENLAWVSRHFNTIKGTRTEDEVKMSGLDTRYKEIFNKDGEFNYENY